MPTTVCLEKPLTHHSHQKFADFFTNQIVSMRQKLDSAVAPSSSVSNRVYNGLKLCGFEPFSEQFVETICLSSSPKSPEV